MRRDQVGHDKNTVQCADSRYEFENLQFRQPADNPFKHLRANGFFNFTVLGGGAGGAMLEKVVDTFDDLYDRLRIVCQSAPQGAEVGLMLNLHIPGTIQGQDRTADIRKDGTYIKGKKILQIWSPNLSDYSIKSLFQRLWKA